MSDRVRTFVTLGGEERTVYLDLPTRRIWRGDGRNGEGLSPDQARTKRNNETLAQGRHPATGKPLLAGHRCGECVFHRVVEHGRRNYHKCEHHRLGESRSSASDIRVGWPACALFVALEEL